MNIYNKTHCSPIGSKNVGSCLNRKLLEMLDNQDSDDLFD